MSLRSYEPKRTAFLDLVDRAVNCWSDGTESIAILDTEGAGFIIARTLTSHREELDALFSDFGENFSLLRPETFSIMMGIFKAQLLPSFLSAIYYLLIYDPEKCLSETAFKPSDAYEVRYLLEVVLWEVSHELDHDEYLLETYGQDTLDSSPDGLAEDHDPVCLSDTDPELLEGIYTEIVGHYTQMLLNIYDMFFRPSPDWLAWFQELSQSLREQLGTHNLNHNQAVGSCYVVIEPTSLNPTVTVA